MRFYNATQAALEIGISYRTIRRRIEACQIEAVRGNDGQYSIAQSEVERLKRAQAERPRPAMTSQEQTGHERPDLEQRVADLEQRVRTLEAMVSQDRTVTSHVPTESLQSQNKPFNYAVDKTDVQPQQSPQRRNVATKKSALPDGCILCSEFAKQHGIPVRSMYDYLVLGIGKGTVPGEIGDPMVPVKEQIDYSERPKPGRPKETERYFDEEQVEKAIEVLRRHGKIKEASE